jgi:hypothetical protein
VTERTSGLLRTSRPVAVLAAVLALAACGKSPTRVFQAVEEAAKAGDDAGFASHFTAQSEPFARALLSVYRTQSAAGGPPSKPLETLATATVEEERLEGGWALLTVRTGSERSVVAFKQEGGEWKLDVDETDARNPRE